MLILVAVTISMAVNGGLFGYAKKSVVEYDVSREKEIIEQSKMMAMLEHQDLIINRTSINKALDEIIGEENYNSDSMEEGIEVTFNGSGRTYIIDYNEQVKPEYFYVYKASDCSVERILITDEIAQGFDITKKVDEDNYYAGYYSTYGGTTADIPNLSYVNNKATDESGEIYDGSLGNKISDGVFFWRKAARCTQLGTNMIPENGKVYYLKEIPGAYLTLKVMTFCNTNTNIINNIYVFSAIDNSYYQKNIIEVVSDKTKESKTLMGGSFSFSSADGHNMSVSIQDFNNLERGIVLFRSDILEMYNPNMEFTVTPCYITFDGVKVSGPSRTFNTGNDGNGNCTDATFHEVIN